jgi:hypothetical protein
MPSASTYVLCVHPWAGHAASTAQLTSRNYGRNEAWCKKACSYSCDGILVDVLALVPDPLPPRPPVPDLLSALNHHRNCGLS